MRSLIVSIVACLFFCGCKPSTKHLVQDYKLERFDENGKYYVIASEDLSGGGVFDGTVEQLGFDQNWILARVNRLYQGDTNGWYVLNLKTKQVVGPIQESDLKTNAAWTKIEYHDPEQVFSGK
ncbi:MAG TPA: hypothetical protein VG938_11960 [Verrucomicrobiae bacterium]|jgi:hypothetical protein|nr:hypothetical protein [Verrucomicrobiae bacterium]